MIYILALLPHLLWGQIQFAPDSLPLELELITRSLELTDNPVKKLKLETRLNELNPLLSQISKTELFSLVKLLTYRTLLNYGVHHSKTEFDLGLISQSEMKDKYEKSKILFSPFTSWFFEVLLQDLANLSTSSGTISAQQGTFLRYWFYSLKTKLPQDIEKEFQELMEKILDHLNGQLEAFVTLSPPLEDAPPKAFFILPQLPQEPVSSEVAPTPEPTEPVEESPSLDLPPDGPEVQMEEKAKVIEEVIETQPWTPPEDITP